MGDFVVLDTETVGLTGPIVLMQYAEGMTGPITLWSPWSNPIRDTLDRIEFVISKKILGFNLAFDWFKIQQAWTTYKILGKRVGYSEIPLEHIDNYALCELNARDGPCLKPPGALDLMLHARKGPWQNLMNRDPIVIRRVPKVLAPFLIKELNARLKIPDIFFAKRKDLHEGKWKVKKIITAEGEHPDLVDLVLPFAPSSALKALATYELKLDPAKTLVFSDVEVDAKHRPNEFGFAPVALAVGKPGRWNGSWPDKVQIHHEHWLYNDLAREYATKDIEYPRGLYAKWNYPAFDDVDSLLAISAGAKRWKGFTINSEGMDKLKAAAQKRLDKFPECMKGRKVIEYLGDVLTDVEKLGLIDPKTGKLSTKKVLLEEIEKLKECADCLADVKHEVCKKTQHRASKRARVVLDARSGKKEIEVYDKLKLATRFHVAENVIGTRSSRKSGGQVTEGKKVKKQSGLNPQGINKNKDVRRQFPLAFTEDQLKALCASVVETVKSLTHDHVHHVDPVTEWAELGYPIEPEVLVGGDFDSFEVAISAAFYDDEQLIKDLNDPEPPCDHGECKFANWDKKLKEFVPCCSKCTGKPSKPKSIKIHAVIGALVYKGRTYWEIKSTSGKGREGKDGVPGLQEMYPDWPMEHWADLYARAKSAFFALLYFGDGNTLASRLAIEKTEGDKAFGIIMARYPTMAKKRQWFVEHFSPVVQPDGAPFWNEPDDWAESMLGFKRFFTQENQVLRDLFDLAGDIPSEWYRIDVRVSRREGKVQKAANAVRSALYGAMHGLQGANTRAAGNHKIQSTGAELTKELESEVWAFQPIGIHPWVARLMNVHDELPTATVARLVQPISNVVGKFIARRKSLIPMLGMDWQPMATWADK